MNILKCLCCVQGRSAWFFQPRLLVLLFFLRRFRAFPQNGIDVASDVCSKREFLVAADIDEGPFPIGALNTFGAEEKIDFVDFFATLYNHCTLDHDQLLEFTFNLANIDGSGYLSFEELSTLVCAISSFFRRIHPLIILHVLHPTPLHIPPHLLLIFIISWLRCTMFTELMWPSLKWAW